MLWNPTNEYILLPFDKETELDTAVNHIKKALFGSTRIYFDDKKKIGE